MCDYWGSWYIWVELLCDKYYYRLAMDGELSHFYNVFLICYNCNSWAVPHALSSFRDIQRPQQAKTADKGFFRRAQQPRQHLKKARFFKNFSVPNMLSNFVNSGQKPWRQKKKKKKGKCTRRSFENKVPIIGPTPCADLSQSSLKLVLLRSTDEVQAICQWTLCIGGGIQLQKTFLQHPSKTNTGKVKGTLLGYPVHLAVSGW